MQLPHLILGVLIWLPLVHSQENGGEPIVTQLIESKQTELEEMNSDKIAECGLVDVTMRSICSGRYPQETFYLFFLPLVNHLDLYSIYVSETNATEYLLLLFDGQPYGCDSLKFSDEKRGHCHSTGADFAAANPHTVCVNTSLSLLDHLLMMCSAINLDRREFPLSTKAIIFYTDIYNDDGIMDPRDFKDKATSTQSNIYALIVVFLNLLMLSK